MRLTLLASSLALTLLPTIYAWCPPRTWQDQNGHCHFGSPPGPPIGYQAYPGGPISFYNGPNDGSSPGGSGTSIFNQNSLSSGLFGGANGSSSGGDNVNWIQNGYTRSHNPGQFFNNYRNTGLNPFRGMSVIPFLDIDWNEARNVRVVHSVMASIAFVGLFPLGGIVAALLPGMVGVGVHVAVQMLGWLFFLIGAAMGMWICANVKWRGFDFPVSGALGHIASRKRRPGSPVSDYSPNPNRPGHANHPSARPAATSAGRGLAGGLHIWIGRLTIITGIINGGLGMYVAGNASGLEIMAYSIFAVLVVLAWIGAMAVGALKRHRRDVPRRRRTKGEVVDEDLMSGGVRRREV